MNHPKAGAVALALAAAMLLATTGADARTLAEIQKAGVIKVGIDLNSPTHGEVDSNMHEQGSDVDTARYIAGKLGVKLSIVKTSQSNRIPFLLTDNVDIVVSTLSITPERAKVIDFSYPYATIQSGVLGPRSVNIAGPKDLVGKTVVVERGTTDEANLDKGKLPGTKVVQFDNAATCITSIVTGRADAFSAGTVMLAPINAKFEAQGVPTRWGVKFVWKDSPTGVGIKKGHPKLMHAVNEAVLAGLDDGTFNKISERYQEAPLSMNTIRHYIETHQE